MNFHNFTIDIAGIMSLAPTYIMQKTHILIPIFNRESFNSTTEKSKRLTLTVKIPELASMPIVRTLHPFCCVSSVLAW